MATKRGRNPYQVLRLSATASLQEVIERSKELSRETLDRAEQAEYRRAVEEIRQHPVRRALSQFWEPPGSCYEDALVEEFCRRHRKPPFSLASLEERKRRFVEHDCSATALAGLAIPPTRRPQPSGARCGGLLQGEPKFPIEPWELFL